MAEQKYVDVTVVNNSGQTVALRLTEDHDMVAHLQKMARREELAKADVKPVAAPRKTATKPEN